MPETPRYSLRRDATSQPLAKRELQTTTRRGKHGILVGTSGQSEFVKEGGLESKKMHVFPRKYKKE